MHESWYTELTRMACHRYSPDFILQKRKSTHLVALHPSFKLEMIQRRLIYSPVNWKTIEYLTNLQEIPRGSAEILWFLMLCISGTARWKNLVLGSYCRATQELSNGAWIMGIGPREPKCPTFCARHFFERLRIACTKTFTAELMEVSGL